MDFSESKNSWCATLGNFSTEWSTLSYQDPGIEWGVILDQECPKMKGPTQFLERRKLTKPTTTTQRKQRPLLYFCIITSLKYKLRMVNLQYCFKIMWRCDNSPSMNAWEHSWAKPTNASSVLTMCGLRAYQFRTTSCQVSRAYGKNIDTTFFAPH